MGDINPGFPPNRPRLGDPARQVGGQGRDMRDMAQRLGALERLLSSYREKQVEVRKSDGTFQTITVLAKEGGEATGSSFGTTIEPKVVEKKEGKWHVQFYPAKLAEHTLLHAGETHSITVPGGNLDTDPTPFIPIAADSDVWLAFDITPSAIIQQGTVKLVVGKMPERQNVVPARPGSAGKDGKHVQKVGKFVAVGDGITWVPENTHAIFFGFFPAIESVGDGERLFDTYLPNPPTDKWRSVRGQSESELEAAGWNNLKNDFNETSGFEIRELPLKMEVELIGSTIVLKGKVKVPIPNGMEGDYFWQHCESEGDQDIKASVKRGIILNSLSNAGTFIAAGCDRSSDMPGP